MPHPHARSGRSDTGEAVVVLQRRGADLQPGDRVYDRTRTAVTLKNVFTDQGAGRRFWTDKATESNAPTAMVVVNSRWYDIPEES